MEIDVNQVCRSCLCKNNDSKDMYEIREPVKNHRNSTLNWKYFDMSIAEVIMACTVVKITQYDGLPQLVCSKCLHLIQQAFDFKKMCEDSDVKLRQQINKDEPIYGIKSERDDSDNLFEPETVLITEYNMSDVENESSNTLDQLDFKLENSTPSQKTDVKIRREFKMERIPSDVDENTLMGEAEAQMIGGRYPCKFCDKTLADRGTYRLHIRLHTGSNLKRCTVCERGFAKQSHLDRHLATHSKEKKCKFCGDIFPSDVEHKEHIGVCSSRKSNKKEADKTGNGETIRKLKKTKQEVEVSDQDNDSDSDYNPETERNMTDGKKSTDQQKESRKMKNIPLDEEELKLLKSAKEVNGRFECPICSKTLARQNILVLHIRTHVGKNLFRCQVCDKGFAKGSNLNRHMILHNIDGSTSESTIKTEKKQRTPKKVPDNEDDVDGDDDDEDEQLVRDAELINGRYRCKFCDKTLATQNTLKLHIRLHLKKKLKVCSICGHGFSKNSHLDRHMKTHIEKKQECQFCHTIFESHQKLRAHMVALHVDVNASSSTEEARTSIVPWTQANGNKIGQCMICDAVFENLSQLRYHLNWHETTTDWISEVDLPSRQEYFQTINEFQYGKFSNEDMAKILQAKLIVNSPEVTRMYRITNSCGWELSLTDSETDGEDTDIDHKRMYNCSKCQQAYDRLHKLMCHMKENHSSKDFQSLQCQHCLLCFPNDAILAKHLRQQCENDQKTVHCKMCYSRFTWQSSLDNHINIYHGNESKLMTMNIQPRPYKCNLCQKSFHRKDKLKEHELRHLPQEKRFSCDICQKRFHRMDYLRRHMQVHVPLNEREPVERKLCSYCGQSFSSASNLQVHIRSHTGERPFPCEFCPARFRRSCDLICHRRSHTGEKPCLCLVCGKRFSRSNKLVRHMRIHTGERPYKCTECDRAFTQSNDLRLHIRRHTGDKPFVCDCGDRFITNSLLRQHQRTHGHVNETARVT